MKKIIVISAVILSACSANTNSSYDAEQDFANHQYHVQQSFEKQYDPEYVDDCYYYEELVCEFE